MVRGSTSAAVRGLESVVARKRAKRSYGYRPELRRGNASTQPVPGRAAGREEAAARGFTANVRDLDGGARSLGTREGTRVPIWACKSGCAP